MSLLYLLRHGRTAWNETGRIQGRADIPLSPLGHAEIESITLPERWLKLKWYCSPLARARLTARLLGTVDAEIVPALIETNWGEFEGLTLAEIERQIITHQLSPARGLDMQPPGGESPRMVARRLESWLIHPANTGRDSFCVTHKGVMRAALNLATGWDMQTPFCHKINWRLPLSFTIAPNGELSLNAVNVAW